MTKIATQLIPKTPTNAAELYQAINSNDLTPEFGINAKMISFDPERPD